MKKCLISIDTISFEVNMKNTVTADIISNKLPLKGEPLKWGEEYYIYTELTNIKIEEDAKQVIEIGEIAFWPKGSAIAIGYGPTPISLDNEIRLADKCNIWGHTKFDLRKLSILKYPKILSITNT